MNVRALDQADIPRVAQYLAEEQLAGLSGLPNDSGLSHSADEVAEAVEKWRTDGQQLIRVIEVGGEAVGHVRSGWWWDAMTPWMEVVVRPGDRRRGHGSAAGRWMLRHLFGSTPAHVVHASTPDWNADGIRLAERLGFERAGTLRRTGIRKGRYFDSLEFELLRRRWDGLDAAQR